MRPPPAIEPGRTGVETKDGSHELDVLVYATGFDVQASICSFPTTGR